MTGTLTQQAKNQSDHRGLDVQVTISGPMLIIEPTFTNNEIIICKHPIVRSLKSTIVQSESQTQRLCE